MVDITTVYNRDTKQLQYVYINEEALIIANHDFIFNELPGDLEAEDVTLIDISRGYFTTQPSFDNDVMNSLEEDEVQLLLSCQLSYIRNYCKHTNDHYFTTVDTLPQELYRQLTNDYVKWLDSNNQLVETDGYKIFVDNRYYKELEDDTPNGIAAKELQQHINCLLPPDVPIDHPLYEKHCNEKIQIIVSGKLFTFDNGADIYNGLCCLVNEVIDNQ